MTGDAEAGYRSRLVLAYVESLAPALTDEETASVARVPGDLRTTLGWVLLRRGDAVPIAPAIMERNHRRAHGLLVAAVLAALLLIVPATAF